MPEGLADEPGAAGVEEEELPQPPAASPRHTIPSNAPKRALFTVREAVPKDASVICAKQEDLTPGYSNNASGSRSGATIAGVRRR